MGLGDYFPTTLPSRIFWQVYVIMGVSLVGMFLGIASEYNGTKHREAGGTRIVT